jgi:hypothetical protein
MPVFPVRAGGTLDYFTQFRLYIIYTELNDKYCGMLTYSKQKHHNTQRDFGIRNSRGMFVSG